MSGRQISLRSELSNTPQIRFRIMTFQVQHQKKSCTCKSNCWKFLHHCLEYESQPDYNNERASTPIHFNDVSRKIPFKPVRHTAVDHLNRCHGARISGASVLHGTFSRSSPPTASINSSVSSVHVSTTSHSKKQLCSSLQLKILLAPQDLLSES